MLVFFASAVLQSISVSSVPAINASCSLHMHLARWLIFLNQQKWDLPKMLRSLGISGEALTQMIYCTSCNSIQICPTILKRTIDQAQMTQ